MNNVLIQRQALTPVIPEGVMSKREIEAEFKRRVAWYKPQNHLITRYYRIRRNVAYPIPIRAISLPRMPVAGISSYPWATWLAWDLEERIYSLGWGGMYCGDDAARALAARDLDALSEWPCYRQSAGPDLSMGHCCRLLWLAHRSWSWLDTAVRTRVEDALSRAVEDGLPYIDRQYGAFSTKTDILALEMPHRVLHNIPLIGTLGIALAAHAIGHTAAAGLDRRLHAILGAVLDLRAQGYTEGVGYDGYVMDFVASWLQILPEAERAHLVEHPRFNDLLDQSIHLAVPGDVTQVAEIGDVEPVEMPYHLSAHAKLLAIRANPYAAWLLMRCRLDRLRADALGALHGCTNLTATISPEPGMADAHYAATLRSGWEPDDLAIAMSDGNSPMGHLPPDRGTIVIGSRGRWLIGDPGYQQYLQKTERTFTLGVTAHNTPVINGQAATQIPPRRCSIRTPLNNGLLQVAQDLTAAYPALPGVASVRRNLWLRDRDLAIIADEVIGDGVTRIVYHWHGHPDAAWWVADGWARLYFPDVTLWIMSPQAQISDEHVDRLPGSRGQLTLTAEAVVDIPAIWWIFAKGPSAPVVSVSADGRTLTADNILFSTKLG